MNDGDFDGAIVFSTTMRRHRDELGDRITRWLGEHPHLVPIDTVVTQTSDVRFHCLTIVVFWRRAR
jgi:hypothetical protein